MVAYKLLWGFASGSPNKDHKDTQRGMQDKIDGCDRVEGSFLHFKMSMEQLVECFTTAERAEDGLWTEVSQTS